MPTLERVSRARYQSATLDLEDGKTEQARSELEKLTKEIPKFVEAYVSLATVYYCLKRRAARPGAKE